MAKKRIQANFSDDLVKKLEKLQESYGEGNLSEVLRDAIYFYDWARQQRSNGWSIGAFQENGKVKEAILPFDQKAEGE
ncbi:hypothetical protein EH222_06130 [candidate division KSB1 bacterium]|nr:MAG: hypothetical protein EH222_06130 [candidate division KSB1 bacterium]